MMQVWEQWQGELLATVGSPGDFEEQLARAGSLAEPSVAPVDTDDRDYTASGHELRKKHS